MSSSSRWDIPGSLLPKTVKELLFYSSTQLLPKAITFGFLTQNSFCPKWELLTFIMSDLELIKENIWKQLLKLLYSQKMYSFISLLIQRTVLKISLEIITVGGSWTLLHFWQIQLNIWKHPWTLRNNIKLCSSVFLDALNTECLTSLAANLNLHRIVYKVSCVL